MKIAVYNYREFDEGNFFEEFSKKYDLKLVQLDMIILILKQQLNLELK